MKGYSGNKVPYVIICLFEVIRYLITFGVNPLASGQTLQLEKVMPKHARCAVGFCDNDKRYPDLIVKRSHVENLVFHRWPKTPALAEIWRKQVAKSRRDEFKPAPGTEGTFVCSNHFPLGKRTPNNPETDFPSIFLTLSDFKYSKSPKKRKRSSDLEVASTDPATSAEIETEIVAKPESEDSEVCDETEEKRETIVQIPLQFEQFTREFEVKFYTGIPSTEAFKCLFNYVLDKAQNMQYWRGAKTTKITHPRPQPEIDEHAFPSVERKKTGPERKLSLEQELLLTLMKLRLGLLIDDLAFRFKVSHGSVSSIFITWVKLLSKELSVLIIWPSRSKVRNTLPHCFKKLYPKVRCIIDCFECFTDTPSSLDLAATMWSEYKHHYTYKVLVAITPNGAISYVSESYGGRATDIFIVRDSGFLDMLEPYDEVMADRGFKIREELMMRMATLCIPPSKATSMQMLPEDVRKTSNIANVRIYVEQAIGRMKVFQVLKHELPVTLLPISDDIVKVCAALCNLQPPLCT